MDRPLLFSYCSVKRTFKSNIYCFCNGPDPPLADIVLFGLFPFWTSPQGFKMRLGEGSNTLINGGLFSLPNQSGTSQIHPPLGPASLLTHRLVSTLLQGTARRLAHRPMSGSNTICNGPNPPLADIVLFVFFPFWAFPQGFKNTLGEGFYTLIYGGLFSSPTNVRHHI